MGGHRLFRREGRDSYHTDRDVYHHLCSLLAYTCQGRTSRGDLGTDRCPFDPSRASRVVLAAEEMTVAVVAQNTCLAAVDIARRTPLPLCCRKRGARML
jgi:hypothetical protein